LNENTNEIFFVECKWKNLSEREAGNILEELKGKSRFVQWNNDVRKEYFGIVAKKVEGKDELIKKGFFVYDLDDL
jgi:AAA+ ATPase superfamily predicted ATPase